MEPLSEVNVANKLIYKPENQYNLQEALGLKNEKKRWLSYLETMRECLYEKNVDFNTDYRTQKNVITSQIVRAFKKKAPDFPLTGGDWAIKEMLISTIQNKRYYLNKKKNASENMQRVPPSEDLSPVSPQVSQDSVPPLELHNEQSVLPLELHNEQDQNNQDNVSNRRIIREQNEANQETQVPRKRGRGQQNLNNQEIREETQVPRKRGRGQQNLNNQEIREETQIPRKRGRSQHQNNTTKKRTKK